ncbi:glycosyltransferase family 2 protein [Paenibacillus kribbensis]|uniref:glycosyltransferase family 2 protein n=1 Tax=Paenibacillus kribbensis TaxID=172713 RepID=UPI0008399217|nr:glycosyltransferase [Paenibacillus kribbensis]
MSREYRRGKRDDPSRGIRRVQRRQGSTHTIHSRRVRKPAPRGKEMTEVSRPQIQEVPEDILLQGTAAAVVSVCNEESTIDRVLGELEKLPLKDIIVVLNGCTDDTRSIVAKHHPGATLVNIPDRLGHDVGRAVGARMTQADIVLFVDGDLPIPASELLPFLHAVDQGTDVALNDLGRHLPPYAQQDSVTRCKGFLNRILRRLDLGANSLTAVPHALSRRSLDLLGPAMLAVPPKAHAMAVLHGMMVAAVHSVDVIKTNRKRTFNTGKGNAMEQLIVGDHAEALTAVLKVAGTSPFGPVPTRADVAKGRNAR